IGITTNRYPYPAPFDQPFYILINLAIGGNYLGNPNTNQINPSLPGDMIVDYVRVLDQTPQLSITLTANPDHSFALSWPTQIVCHLQTLSNSDGHVDPTAWEDVPDASNPYTVYPDPTTGGAYYRLASP
ncbi:MAG TPA: hypothetical protein VFD66_05325, partial [Verrucomicrobiae bacterium]|nr:hypothetical protein [Verrucomicrobiae bacterium]